MRRLQVLIKDLLLLIPLQLCEISFEDAVRDHFELFEQSEPVVGLTISILFSRRLEVKISCQIGCVCLVLLQSRVLGVVQHSIEVHFGDKDKICSLLHAGHLSEILAGVAAVKEGYEAKQKHALEFL